MMHDGWHDGCCLSGRVGLNFRSKLIKKNSDSEKIAKIDFGGSQSNKGLL